jgi:hypothetical protein
MPRPAAAQHAAQAHLLGAIALLIVAIVTSGCGRDPSSSDSPPSTTPGSAAGTACDLISIDQAIKATGGLNVVDAIPMTDASGCSYGVGDGSAYLAFEYVDELYWNQFQAGPHLKLGLGDESIFSVDRQVLVVLVRDGGDRFAITIHLPRGLPKSDLEIAKSLAGYLLARA